MLAASLGAEVDLIWRIKGVVVQGLHDGSIDDKVCVVVLRVVLVDISG